ncbi:MAG: S1 RNA-binding domain-containing protein [Lachnospiraceae bacterium]|nr:S1 RNA-binding domain-containing protein [Lachnospiraceae bacterium]
MFNLAKRQTLYVEKLVEFGAYLVPEELKDKKVPAANEHVLLPKKQVPEGISRGDSIEVFIYLDSADRLIATTTVPKLSLGEVGRLTVKDVTKIGAFLDWGLEKDLLLPFKEQTKRAEVGDEVLVAVYLDKSGRICSTMNVYPYLTTTDKYKKNDRITGTVYQTSDNFGVFVAIDDLYQGLIPKREVYGKCEIGTTIEARVINVREDGKIDLSIREKSHVQAEADSEKLLALIKSYDGVLPFTEKASPEVINRETGMSKNEFKKAVGHLYKKRLIEITFDGKIKLV